MLTLSNWPLPTKTFTQATRPTLDVRRCMDLSVALRVVRALGICLCRKDNGNDFWHSLGDATTVAAAAASACAK